jgi:hypothetical protein
MNDNASREAALAMLAATYGSNPLPDAAEPIIVVLPTKVKAPKVAKTPKGKRVSKDAAPKTLSSAVLPSNMPAIGSIDAQTFLLTLRGVGMRSKEDTNAVTGEVFIRRFHDPSFNREDTIKAIHAFIGYDVAGDFGAQDVAARAEAQRQLRGNVVPAQYHRRGGACVAPSIQGYTAGAPDFAAKRKADLLGRERHSVNERLRHLKNAADPAFVAPTNEAAPALMAALEEERLVEIRKDLDSL